MCLALPAYIQVLMSPNLHLSLSTYLYGATLNQTYGAAAELAAEFVWNQLYNGTIILDTITLSNCKQSSTLNSYNSGMVIEGLSDLQTYNMTWTPR